ncbi:MAG: gamma-glutamyl-gamma-aminobutyrate hydrolase family protein, partial [Gammaproteobacteria bacterium]|nr:gamma-glutamyl-gamma-aminobutyrate hydrolase family protein [Gammaproteobacteria bacterium]
MNRYPVVGIPSDVTRYGLSSFHGAGEKYINAVANGADVCPLIIPAQGPGEDLQATDSDELNQRLLDNLDGLFLSGSPSNIQPSLYSDEESETPDDHDPQRDSLSLPLIRAAMKRKMPILAVCRGMQELNVAMGGTLHQKVHKIAKMMDHREDKTLDRVGQYQDAHNVKLIENGALSKLIGSDSARVNSLHG